MPDAMISLLSNVAFFAGIALWIFFGIHFAKSAAQKGHSFRLWLVICLLFGPFGYAFINSLSDLPLQERIDQLENRIEKLEALVRMNTQNGKIHPTDVFSDKPESTSQVSLSEDEWLCGFCATRNKRNYGQCKICGSFRSN